MKKIINRERWIIGAILLIAALHGIVYVFIMPPWQHYDETNHFEYARLIAQTGSIPGAKDADLDLRREIVQSMMRHQFYDGMGWFPDPNNDQQMTWIGDHSQLGIQPLYYLVASIPVRFLLAKPIEVQLYAARLVSVLLFFLVVLSAWGIAVECLPGRRVWQSLLPLAVALHPGLLDSMSSVNSDVGAVTLFSIFLWGCVRLLRRGFQWKAVLVTAIIVVLCFFTKETVYLAAPLFLLALLFSIVRGSPQRVLWIGLFSAGLLALGLVLTWGEPASWYRSSLQEENYRARSDQAVAGEYVFQLYTAADVSPTWMPPFYQPLPQPDFTPGGELTFTLGAWMWSDVPTEFRSLELRAGSQVKQVAVNLSQEPQFVALTAKISTAGMYPLRVAIGRTVKTQAIGATIYYDGLVLVWGERPVDDPPQFDGPDASSGVWGGEPFENLIRNASAEQGGPRFRNVLERYGARFMPEGMNISLLLPAFYDWQGMAFYYQLTILRLSRTFWGYFGWGHFPLLGHKPYRLLGWISMLMVAASLVWAVQQIRLNRKRICWSLVLFLSLALASIWGSAIFRSVMYTGTSHLYISVARYTFPVIIPTLLVLQAGWFFLISTCWERYKNFWQKILPLMLWVIFYLILIGVSVATIVRYYA